MLLFDVLVHLGTLVAVGIVFRQPAKRCASRLIRESSRSWMGRRYAWSIMFLALAAVVPTAVIGLAFQPTFEEAFAKPVSIGVCLLVTGGLLAALIIVKQGRRGWKRFHWWEAVFVGLAQAAAILPGISRSGATICMASYFGWRRRELKNQRRLDPSHGSSRKGASQFTKATY